MQADIYRKLGVNFKSLPSSKTISRN